MDNKVVPAGLLGSYYAARYKHRQYLSFAITARYTFSNPSITCSTSRFGQILRDALWQTIFRHPALSYGVVSSTPTTPAHFLRQDQICWEDVVGFLEPTYTDSADADEKLCQHLSCLVHEWVWKDQERKPAWMVFVVPYETATEASSTVEIIFVCHHALCDGLSGAAFHKTLFKEMEKAVWIPQGGLRNEISSEWPFTVPMSTPHPISVENFLYFPPADTVLHEAIGSGVPSFPWPGNTALPQTEHQPIRTLIKFITIPFLNLQLILSTLRTSRPARSITLTGLIHALIVIYLSRTIPSATTLVGITPYSLRRFTGLSADGIANHISYAPITWSNEIIDFIRRHAFRGAHDEILFIWDIAQRLQNLIARELRDVREKGSQALVVLSRITDWDFFCEEASTQERSSTYEVSNLGAVDFSRGQARDVSGDAAVEVERLIFTQGAMVVGPAIGCSVASVVDGPLVVSLHWQERVVDKEIMAGLKEHMEEWLRKLGS